MRAIFLAISACLLGAALQVRDGLYSPLAIALLAASILCVGASLVLNRQVKTKWIELSLLICLLAQFILLFRHFPGAQTEAYSIHDHRTFAIFMSVVCALVAIAILARRLEHAAFAGLLLVYIVAGIWLLRKTPQPYMDVFVFQQESSQALANGENPYAISFTDLYKSSGPVVYAPGVQRNGRLMFGFPYMPLVLEWNFFAQLIAPDYRYANLFAIALAALLIADVGRSRASMLAGALLLFTPRGFFLVEQGWTEPLTVLLLALTIWCARRFRRALPIALGLLLASKQYCLFMVPLIGLLWFSQDGKLVPRDSRGAKLRSLVQTVLVASVVTLPFVLLNIRAFWESAVALQFRQPFRDDSLSFPALFAQHGFGHLSGNIAIVSAFLIAIFCAIFLKPSPHAFSLGVTVVFLTFFAMNKQAFANYYLLVLAAMCCAIAASFMPGEANVRYQLSDV